MNLLLIHPQELVSSNQAQITGDRAAELRDAHELIPGVRVRAGILGGLLGHATVLSVGAEGIALDLVVAEPPPPRVPVILVVGLSRPQTIKKIIQAAVTLGVEELHLVRSERGERSYLSSTVLQPESLTREVELGLSQAVDTIAPHIAVHQRFLPFVEDLLPVRLEALPRRELVRVLADTRCASALPPTILSAGSQARVVAAIGPEAGWSEYELEKFRTAGFAPVSLGARIVRVETAVTTLAGMVASRQPVTI